MRKAKPKKGALTVNRGEQGSANTAERARHGCLVGHIQMPVAVRHTARARAAGHEEFAGVHQHKHEGVADHEDAEDEPAAKQQQRQSEPVEAQPTVMLWLT